MLYSGTEQEVATLHLLYKALCAPTKADHNVGVFEHMITMDIKFHFRHKAETRERERKVKKNGLLC